MHRESIEQLRVILRQDDTVGSGDGGVAVAKLFMNSFVKLLVGRYISECARGVLRAFRNFCTEITSNARRVASMDLQLIGSGLGG